MNVTSGKGVTSGLQVQLKMWEEKARTVAEERVKHRAALETELRTLRAAQEELAAKFDDSLTTLQTVLKPALLCLSVCLSSLCLSVCLCVCVCVCVC